MCQLLGMNCATPTDFNFSFRGFARRGGETDKHEHGWGICAYEGRGLRTFLDPLPAARSPVADLVARYPMKTLNMMAHIRYATQGTVSLENVHPFQREMWGIQWCFAHNGEVPKYTAKSHDEHPLLGRTKRGETTYHPVGDTDSEAVFCALLNALRAEFDTLPTLPVLYETIQRLCCEIVSGDEGSTILNFLLGCGQYTLFAYSWPGARPGSTCWNGLHYCVRRPPFSTARLADVDYAVDFSDVTTPSDRVAVIATKPLTVDERWTEFERGRLLMFDNGHPYSELYDCDEVERQGRGLSSRVLPKAAAAPRHDGDGGGELPYNTPALLRRMVDDAVAAGRTAALGSGDGVWARRGADLGCGSGLSGLAFRSCVRRLTGVDLSREMVDKARERGCHDRLVVGDVESVLRRGDDDDDDAGMFDLIFACDVFVYIGDLRPVFRSVRDSLVPGEGVFAFSAEFLEEEDEKKEEDGGGAGGTTAEADAADARPFVLQACARFAHERDYVEGLAREYGFEIKAMRTSPIRKYEGKDVKGALAVMGLPKRG